ncbi:MAG: S24/S26 family peptidase, partial [Candidatus Omnitrophota bacterium]
MKLPGEDLLFFETSGFSMWPFIRPGERLVIKKSPAQDLRAGDIILYRANNQLACHRLVKKNRDFLWT